MRIFGAFLLLATALAGCAGGAGPEAPAPAGLLQPEDPLAAARDAFRAHPEGIRLLVIVSPT